MTGPRLLTFADAVAEIPAAASREIRYVPVSIDAIAAQRDHHLVPIVAERDIVTLRDRPRSTRLQSAPWWQSVGHASC